jgi:hypothetical protein
LEAETADAIVGEITRMPTQPRYLTLPEVALNLGLACGIGFWVAGIVGASLGAVVVIGRYVFLIGRSI